MEVFENVEYRAKHLILYRGSHAPDESHTMFKALKEYIKRSGARQLGHVISVTYASDNETRVSDTQVFIPIDTNIPCAENYTFIPELSLTNCLMVKHKGDTRFIPNSYAALLARADNLGLQVKMPIYNVIVSEPTQDGSNALEIEIYAALES